MVVRADAEPHRFLAGWLRDGRLLAGVGLDVARELGAIRRLVAQQASVDPDALRDPSTDL